MVGESRKDSENTVWQSRKRELNWINRIVIKKQKDRKKRWPLHNWLYVSQPASAPVLEQGSRDSLRRQLSPRCWSHSCTCRRTRRSELRLRRMCLPRVSARGRIRKTKTSTSATAWLCWFPCWSLHWSAASFPPSCRTERWAVFRSAWHCLSASNSSSARLWQRRKCRRENPKSRRLPSRLSAA